MSYTKANIRNLLGMTQSEMALLLQIERGRLSMFESGKRQLPMHALERLAQLEIALSKTTAQPQKFVTCPEPSKSTLQMWQQENHYATAVLQRKIDVAEKKLQITNNRTTVASYFAESGKDSDVARFFTRKTPDISGNGFCEDIARMKHQLKLLEYEKSILERGGVK